jgi:thiamine-phosphate pyrophosphorylase
MDLAQILPDVWLLSDARNDGRLESAIAALPPGSGFVYRHYHLDPATRRRRFETLRPLLSLGGHLAVLSGNEDEADAWGLVGIYGHADLLGSRADLLRIAPVHDAAEIDHANAFAADAVMLSPVYRTRSHPHVRPLGPERFHALATLAEMPVIALGGMTASRAKELGWTRWAAVDGLSA